LKAKKRIRKGDKTKSHNDYWSKHYKELWLPDLTLMMEQAIVISKKVEQKVNKKK
tara:strand:- start:1828 stop:1992 length:165 start_codon:yes stop_codon:yes gene_type:complete